MVIAQVNLHEPIILGQSNFFTPRVDLTPYKLLLGGTLLLAGRQSHRIGLGRLRGISSGILLRTTLLDGFALLGLSRLLFVRLRK